MRSKFFLEVIFIKRIHGLFLLTLIFFSGCTLTSPQPETPVLDPAGRECTVTYGKITYTAYISLPCSDKTVIEFTSPEGIAGTRYTFCGNTLELNCGELAFSSGTPYLPESSLPAVLNSVFTDIRLEDSLVYSHTTSDSSGQRYALFCGNTDKFDYTVKTDFESGLTKEIYSDDNKFSIVFENSTL